MTTMIETLLTVAGGCAMTGATLALWVHDRRISHQRIFAVLVSITVTVSLFSMIAWAAVAVVAVAPICVTWTFVRHAGFALCRPLVSRAA